MARVSIQGRSNLKRSLRRYAKRVRRQVAFEMTAVMEDIQDVARQMAPYETGQLLGSIQPSPRQVDPDDLTGYVGTNVEYARVQEFGFTGTVNVDAHRREQTHVFGRELDDSLIVTVDAHTRRMDIEGKFYMTKAAQAAAQTYHKRMADAVQRASP